jgi:hypothetical protein
LYSFCRYYEPSTLTDAGYIIIIKTEVKTKVNVVYASMKPMREHKPW